MNLRAQLMQKLSELRAAADAVSTAIDRLDAVNPPALQTINATATDAPNGGLFFGDRDLNPPDERVTNAQS